MTLDKKQEKYYNIRKKSRRNFHELNTESGEKEKK